MKKTFLLKTMLLLCALVVGGSAWATDVVDQLNNSDFTATGTSYANFSNVQKNTAVYAGRTSIQNNSIGMKRDNSNGAGIFTTTSGGVAKSLSFTWTSTSDRTLQVWGKNSAYSLDDTKNQTNFGTKITEVTYDSNNTNPTLTLNSTTDYEYILIVPSSTSMLSIKDVEITWEVSSGVGPATLSVDFENALTNYSQWISTNIVRVNDVTGVSAHGGSYWGNTNGKATASIATKTKIAYPGIFTCYVSKESNNETASTWYVQTSSDGSSWTDVASKDAKAMSKGEWQVFTADLSSNSNVYVRLYYSGSTAKRAVDDIVLTKRDVAAITNAGWATWNALDPVSFPNDINAYIVSPATNDDEVTLTRVTSVPANTPVLLQGDAGTYSMNIVESSTTNVSSNCLHVSDGTAASTTTDPIYVLSKPTGEEVGFYKWAVGTTLPAGKIYLQLSSDVRSFIALPGEETGISATLMNNEQRINNNVYDLQGRPVAQPTKGLYIVNGKKVIIK